MRASATAAFPVSTPRTGTSAPGGHHALRRDVVAILLVVLGVALVTFSWPTIGSLVWGEAPPADAVIDPSPGSAVATTDGALALEVPWDGAVVIGTALEIRGVASRPLGAIRAAVTSGTTVLGATALIVDGPGPFRVSVPLAAIGTVGKARLTISNESAGRARVHVTRDLTVCVVCL